MKNKEICENDKNNKEIKFFISFNEDGESFQNIMEKILISKINNKN